MANPPDQYDYGTDQYGLMPYGSVGVTPPLLMEMNPVNGSRSQEPTLASVVFQVVNKQSGVDLASCVVQVSLNGAAYSNVFTGGAFVGVWVGSSYADVGGVSGEEYEFTLNTMGRYSYGDLVLFKVYMKDNTGNFKTSYYTVGFTSQQHGRDNNPFLVVDNFVTEVTAVSSEDKANTYEIVTDENNGNLTVVIDNADTNGVNEGVSRRLEIVKGGFTDGGVDQLPEFVMREAGDWFGTTNFLPNFEHANLGFLITYTIDCVRDSSSRLLVYGVGDTTGGGTYFVRGCYYDRYLMTFSNSFEIRPLTTYAFYPVIVKIGDFFVLYVYSGYNISAYRTEDPDGGVWSSVDTVVGVRTGTVRQFGITASDVSVVTYPSYSSVASYTPYYGLILDGLACDPDQWIILENDAINLMLDAYQTIHIIGGQFAGDYLITQIFPRFVSDMEPVTTVSSYDDDLSAFTNSLRMDGLYVRLDNIDVTGPRAHFYSNGRPNPGDGALLTNRLIGRLKGCAGDDCAVLAVREDISNSAGTLAGYVVANEVETLCIDVNASIKSSSREVSARCGIRGNDEFINDVVIGSYSNAAQDHFPLYKYDCEGEANLTVLSYPARYTRTNLDVVRGALIRDVSVRPTPQPHCISFAIGERINTEGQSFLIVGKYDCVVKSSMNVVAPYMPFSGSTPSIGINTSYVRVSGVFIRGNFESSSGTIPISIADEWSDTNTIDGLDFTKYSALPNTFNMDIAQGQNNSFHLIRSQSTIAGKLYYTKGLGGSFWNDAYLWSGVSDTDSQQIALAIREDGVKLVLLNRGGITAVSDFDSSPVILSSYTAAYLEVRDDEGDDITYSSLRLSDAFAVTFSRIDGESYLNCVVHSQRAASGFAATMQGFYRWSRWSTITEKTAYQYGWDGFGHPERQQWHYNGTLDRGMSWSGHSALMRTADGRGKKWEVVGPWSRGSVDNGTQYIGYNGFTGLNKCLDTTGYKIAFCVENVTNTSYVGATLVSGPSVINGASRVYRIGMTLTLRSNCVLVNLQNVTTLTHIDLSRKVHFIVSAEQSSVDVTKCYVRVLYAYGDEGHKLSWHTAYNSHVRPYLNVDRENIEKFYFGGSGAGSAEWYYVQLANGSDKLFDPNILVSQNVLSGRLISDGGTVFFDENIDLVWNGLDGVAGDNWTLQSAPMYGADRVIDKNIGSIWRSGSYLEDQYIEFLASDSGRSSFLVDTVFLAGTNFIHASIQAKTETGSWESPELTVEVDNEYGSGTISNYSGAASNAVLLSDTYFDGELTGKLLSIVFGKKNETTYKVLYNEGSIVYLDRGILVGLLGEPRAYKLINTNFVYRLGEPVQMAYWRILIPTFVTNPEQNVPYRKKFEIGEFDIGLAIELPIEDGVGALSINHHGDTAVKQSHSGRRSKISIDKVRRTFDVEYNVLGDDSYDQLHAVLRKLNEKNFAWFVFDYENEPLAFAACQLTGGMSFEALEGVGDAHNAKLTLTEVV